MILVRVTVSVDDTLMAQIQRLAEAEMRSKANMMKILIMEAVEARDGQKTGAHREEAKRGKQG